VFRYILLIVLKLIFFGVAWKHGKLLYMTLRDVGHQASSPSSPKSLIGSKDKKPGDATKETSQQRDSKLTNAPSSPSNNVAKNLDNKAEFSTSDSSPVEASKTTVPSDYVTEKSSKESKLSALHTMLILYAVMSILVIVVIVLLAQALVANLKNKYDASTKPLNVQSLTYYAQFEIIEFVVCCTLLFFFRKILLSSAQKSRGSRGSEQMKVKKDKAVVSNNKV